MSDVTAFTGLCHLLLIYSRTFVTVSGLTCLSCSSVDQPYDCLFVEECKSNEECFIERMETQTGHVSYNVGCRNYHLCAQQQPFGKRRQLADGNVRCVRCCNQKDLCNLDGQCGSATFVLRPGYKLCYQCPLSSSPDNCNQLTLCDQISNCMLMETKNLLGETRWRHGCTQIQECPALSFGGIYPCSFCCNSSLCNSRCILPPIIERQSTTTSTSTLPPIIESHTTTTSTITGATTAHLTSSPLSAPRINLLLIQPENIKYCDTVVITCVVTGNPTPTVEFMFYGAGLTSGMYMHNNQLTISNFLSGDDGEYRCVATNPQGQDIRQFSLHGHS